LSEKTIKKVLTDFGLTEKEGEVYIFLATHGALKSGEIAGQLKKDKAQIFRILKILETKGLVERTLEFPTRFAAVSFETILEASIKSKKEEVALIENAKKDLLNYFKKTRRLELESSLEKFVVIEGTERIYLKALEMIKNTKHHFSAIIPASALAHADEFSFLETVFTYTFESNIHFRFLTELSNQNLSALKRLLNLTKRSTINLEGRTPELGLTLSPQMDIRDDEEALFFIKPAASMLASEKEVCLWTNCKPLVQAFDSVFENLWHNSADISTNIDGIKEKPTTEIGIIKDAATAQQKYVDVLSTAKKEIVMVTSSEGLLSSWKNISLLKELATKNVSIKLMAPITSQNLQVVQELSEFCSVKHVTATCLTTTIVDEQHMFQFSEPEQTKPFTTAYFENTFYTNDSDYLKKTKNMVDDIWKNANRPSTIPLKSIIDEAKSEFIPFPGVPVTYMRKLGATNIIDEKPPGTITEKDVVNKIMNPQKYSAEYYEPKVIDRMYSSVGLAAIHPPNCFNLPDTMLVIHKIEKQSRLGEEDAVMIFLWLETPKGYTYLPVALVGDNPKAHDFWKTCLAGTIAGKNAQLVKKDEIEVRVHGNTLFAGWTVPIPLLLPKYVLPPACILIEGYGNIKTAAYTIAMPLGNKYMEQNYFDAFVTFMHPSSKYSGPGTDGYFIRDSVSTLYSK
jgi:sugar-specific transcriptional regulator TrmB